jgi:feruloyl esterase
MIAAIVAAQLAATVTGMPCERLQGVDVPGVTIKSAESVAAGVFKAPPGPGPRARAAAEPAPIPAHCKVDMLLTPTPDSEINVELWMPLEHWNGKFLAVGNGGWAGAMQGYRDLQEALRRGYATAATDTGHSAKDGPNGMFALGHPEKLVDFAYRAVHDMTVQAKRVVDLFYARPIDYAYFKGCSTGGRQAVMEAQRYPGDFDGIIAGALANRHIHMHTAAAANDIRLARHPDEAVSADKAKLVNDALMKQCDTLHEGFVNDPRQCSFDPASLACSGAETNSCLSQAELRTVETYYAGVKNGRGETIFPGQVLGVPLRPQQSRTEGPGPFTFDTVRILGFQDADYDWHEFDLDRDMPRIDAAAGFVDAVDPDLSSFKAQGGKLLLYAGWSDPAITPKNTIAYYSSVLEEMGDQQSDWMRLFMVPGMGHCGGGDGPSTFDTIGVIEQWREHGQAPTQIAAKNTQSGLSRPLCPYPQTARYDGSGEVADAANWSCAAP